MRPCLPDVAAIVVAAPPAIVVGLRLVTEAPLVVIATNFSIASTLVALRPRDFLTTSSLDDRRTRGASRARPSPHGCLLLIVTFYASTLATTVATIAIVAIVVELSSSYRRQCDPCRDCRVTVMPFLGVLAQRALLARRSLRRFIDVVIVVVAALSAFRRVPRSSLLCCCRCRRNDDYRR